MMEKLGCHDILLLISPAHRIDTTRKKREARGRSSSTTSAKYCSGATRATAKNLANSITNIHTHIDFPSPFCHSRSHWHPSHAKLVKHEFYIDIYALHDLMTLHSPRLFRSPLVHIIFMIVKHKQLNVKHQNITLNDIYLRQQQQQRRRWYEQTNDDFKRIRALFLLLINNILGGGECPLNMRRSSASLLDTKHKKHV